MNLSKLIIAAGALTAAAFATVPFQSTQEDAGRADVPAVDGLLRPVPLASEEAPSPSATQPLQPADPSQTASRASAPEDPFEIEDRLRRRLASPDLDVREEAFDAAVEEAVRSQPARTALHAISEDAGDPDLAFTARLALREANRARVPGSRLQGEAGRGRRLRSARPDAQPGDAGNPFESIQRRMDELMRSDPFLNDFFSGGPFEGDPFFGRSRGQLFGARPGISLFGRSGDPFEEMRQRTEEIRRQFEALQRDAQDPAVPGSRPFTPGSGPSRLKSFSSSSSMSIENTPDGVRVEITEDAGDGPNTRVYEAPNMKALLEANPELKGRVR